MAGNQDRPERRPPGGGFPEPDNYPRRGPGRRFRIALIVAGIWLALLVVALFSFWISELPSTDSLIVYQPGNDVTLMDVKGRMIARRGLVQGETVAVAQLPDYVGNAFIAVEDRRFRHHFGIDPIGLIRAAFVDAAHRQFVQGGSTLTQQLAKNLFLTPARTIRRKIEEAILAVYLETRYSKDQILGFYLNRVYFGAGVYGIEAASERYFDKPATKLTLKESAILAGIVKAPSRYNPEASMDASLSRASLVLAAMEDAQFIDHATRLEATRVKPKFAHSFGTPGAGYFVDYVISQLPALAPGPKERLIVETTLDLDLQRDAESAVTRGLRIDGRKLNASEAALVSLSTDGALRAMVGGTSYDESPFDRAAEANRQPGSAFKPFVYLAALEHGHRPSDEVFDGPVTIGKWSPGNYEGEYEGQITLARALADSSNSAAVQLANEVGPAEVVRVAHRLGVSEMLNPVPSLALGTSEVTPLQLTSAYVPFANGGFGAAPYAVLRIRTGSGHIVYERRAAADPARVMSPQNDAYMTQMLAGTVDEGTGKAATLGDRRVAGKTGTSQDYRDAWFVGFTADHVTGVWIGNDDGTPMKKATGGSLPARIFHSYMQEAERKDPPKELVGLTLSAPDEAAAPTEEPPPAPEDNPKEESHDDVMSIFQNMLDRLF
jgi:penicillin-binding protein 1A